MYEMRNFTVFHEVEKKPTNWIATDPPRRDRMNITKKPTVSPFTNMV